MIPSTGLPRTDALVQGAGAKLPAPASRVDTDPAAGADRKTPQEPTRRAEARASFERSIASAHREAERRDNERRELVDDARRTERTIPGTSPQPGRYACDSCDSIETAEVAEASDLPATMRGDEAAENPSPATRTAASALPSLDMQPAASLPASVIASLPASVASLPDTVASPPVPVASPPVPVASLPVPATSLSAPGASVDTTADGAATAVIEPGSPDRFAAGPTGAATDTNVADARSKLPGSATPGDSTDANLRPEQIAAKSGDTPTPAVHRTAPDSEPALLGLGGLSTATPSAVRPMGIGTHPLAGGTPAAVGHPGFGERFAVEVAMLTTAGIERAEINVFPRDLGPVRIELALNGEAARVAFSATHPDTRQAIEQSLPILKEMLAERGIALSDASVSDGRSGSTRQDDREAAPGSRPGTPPDRHQGATGADPLAVRRRLLPAGSRGLLDVYA